jgi:hypothetical protein
MVLLNFRYTRRTIDGVSTPFREYTVIKNEETDFEEKIIMLVGRNLTNFVHLKFGPYIFLIHNGIEITAIPTLVTNEDLLQMFEKLAGISIKNFLRIYKSQKAEKIPNPRNI